MTELTRGRIDATRAAVERWAGRFEDREVCVALEACTGWLFVSRALQRAGCARCSARGGCRNPGFRRSTCVNGVRGRGCARR
jgi:hypothetical protein